MINKSQIQKIYAVGSKLGMLKGGSGSDLLHTLVFNITQKQHISELTDVEYNTVMRELARRFDSESDESSKTSVKMISPGQKKKVWRLMYQLRDLDAEPSSARLGERLCGVIKKELGVDCTVRDPFCWLTYAQGVKLIEVLKNT